MDYLSTLNWQSVFGLLRDQFLSAQPFPHLVFDNFLKEDVAALAEKNFPALQDPIWYEYDNPLEKKFACNNLLKIPSPLSSILTGFNNQNFADELRALTGIANLVFDPLWHGSGLHCVKRGGKLDIHLDYSIHPKSGLERRVNLIIFFNSDWQENYGGELEFWDATISRCVKKISPIANRAVIFLTGDVSYHGHPEPLKCPSHLTRKSLALYYLSEPREGVKVRYKGLYVKRPQDPDDPYLERLRQLRVNPETASEVYRVNQHLP